MNNPSNTNEIILSAYGKEENEIMFVVGVEEETPTTIDTIHDIMSELFHINAFPKDVRYLSVQRLDCKDPGDPKLLKEKLIERG